MVSTQEPERKRRNLNSSISPPLKKQPLLPSADDKKVDAVMLRYQNQKLAQQLDVQKSEIHVLENKFSQLKSKQASHDTTLTSVQDAWGKLVDNVEVIAARTYSTTKGQLHTSHSLKDGATACVSPEETFLQRLLETGATESSSGSNGDVSDELALKSQQATALRSVEHLVRAIDCQRAKREELYQSLRNGLSSDGTISNFELQGTGHPVQKVENELRQEVTSLRSAMDELHLKHKELAAEVRVCRTNNARDRAELKRLTGELDEAVVELESTRRKLAALRSQKDALPVMPGSKPGVKCESGEKSGEKPLRDTKVLEAAVEEAKNMAVRRLNELEEAQHEKLLLSQQLEKVQESLSDEWHILSSRPYSLWAAQAQHLKIELEHYQSLVDQSQVERENALEHERDATMKAETSESARKTSIMLGARIGELESRLHDCITERNNLQVKLEEASHASEREDEIVEFKVMVSTLHKEMHMMQQQLDKYKEAACSAQSLQAEVDLISEVIERKTDECRSLHGKVADQALEVGLLKDKVRLLHESEQELKLILDMYGSESTESRDVRELKQAKCRAWAQVETLKSALQENSLELRVKAANEAEAACQERFIVAEAETAELRQRLDAAERYVIEINEAVKVKSEERDGYLIEIETIGQAYEDMQAQNQRLLQQISERDDYNIKLVSESVKTKQLQSLLREEKQALMNHINHAISLLEGHKQRVVRLEEQARSYLEQLGKTVDDGRQHVSSINSFKRRSAEAEKEFSATKSSLEAVQKQLEQRKAKMADIQAQLEKERFEKKRIQEDLALLSSKVDRSSVQNGGSSIEKLQDEVKEYRAILKCSVCHDRPKEVVITKCYHLFCSPCIQRNLEIRHRKCPGCGVAFGQNDVRNVYI